MSALTPPRAFEVLLIEDNPGDLILMRGALKNTAVTTLTGAVDGGEAIELLRNRMASVEAGLPDLIVLDLHLPGMDGYEVLAEIRKDRSLRAIPVVVFSSSDAQPDILKSYELGANCYVPKPFDLAGFNDVVGAIMHFWLNIAQLPKKRALAEQL